MSAKVLLDEVGERYRRYLRTTFFIRDRSLRNSFAQALNRENLTKGPYLEMTPRFRQARPLRECLRDWFPGEQWDEGFLASINADRPLYRHQEEAILKAVTDQNVIVATGTGSGKTESFLLPILIHLYRASRHGTSSPGVKALILYPMNALVADQRERLGNISWQLVHRGSAFRFTFGQYIGSTPDSEKDVYRETYDLFPNEMGTRKEMHDTPPDILITNYSMLEYLLIRPTDSALFDAGRARHWKYLVLDEAHQYRGAKGMEMAMLMRRLKDRLQNGGRTLGFTCIATSASLSDPAEDAKGAVASFAEMLFGEPFSPDNVVFGVVDPVELNGKEYPDGSVYRSYLQGLAENGDMGWFVEKVQSDVRLAKMTEILSRKPASVDELATVLFPQEPLERAYQYIDDLATCAVTARPRSQDLPLLPLRYHFLVRSLEGVRIGFRPEPEAYLTGGGKAGEGALFDLALCAHCGQHFIAGRVVGDRLGPSIQDPGHDDFYPQYYRPLTQGMTRDEAKRWDREDAGEGITDSNALLTVCGECGTVGTDGLPTCSHDMVVIVEEVGPGTDDDQKSHCPVCEFTQTDLIRLLVHGSDGPHAVIATALYSKLDAERRKILAFADGRQRAAFFAWYLQDSYETIARRNVLYHALRDIAKDASDIGVLDSANRYAQRLENERMVAESATFSEKRRAARVAVLQEILNEDRHISLEGTGLIYGRIKLPGFVVLSRDLLNPWGMAVEMAQEWSRWILGTLVEDNAVDFGMDDLDFNWGDLALASSQVEALLGPRLGAKGAVSIDGSKTRRVQFTAKLLASLKGEPLNRSSYHEKAQNLIRTLVDVILEGQKTAAARDQVLIRTKRGYRVNLRWWRWHVPGSAEDEPRLLRICSDCHQLSYWNFNGICPNFRCEGRLSPALDSDLEDNHYRRLYLDPLPGRLRAEEHTAQLERAQALEYQREFKQGHIHVLSSSTTFELGVDLGDLNVVFLRNVPPENFNYVQRVGRAGRRPGSPGVAVTYCGRSPHDLYHFESPERMITGKTRTPVIRLGNDALVLRHWIAVILSLYFRQPQNQKRFHSVQDFLGGRMENPDLVASLRSFVASRNDLDSLFERLVPAEVREKIGDDWLEAVLGPTSRLAQAVSEVSGDWKNVKELERIKRDEGDYQTAQWAQKRSNEMARQDVLTFLSRKVVIPKYGFPVDVVGLELLSESPEASTVTLQRDLSVAISEFAPTAQVVANKRVWVSRALKTVPDMAWPRHGYRRCSSHGVLERTRDGQDFDGPPCCERMHEAEYVVPIFGFSTNREPAKKPTKPIERLFSTRPFFADPGGWDKPSLRLGEIAGQPPLMEVYNVRPGDIVVISEGRKGRGFYICPDCGAADTKLLGRHRKPWGTFCDGRPDNPVALAHQFKTDILRIAFPRWETTNLAFIYGVAYALQYGASDYLEVPLTDLNALGLRTMPVSVLLYDNVPGGAGLVSQLGNSRILRQCVSRALERVSGQCGCDAHSSCYGCLRSYSNQFLHHELARGPVYEYVSQLHYGLENLGILDA